ncbi:MAG: hypothetical protein JWN43_3178 [Gammaproteobacteria bacterium]|jgi:hypothetical protein|nr:hypothetical protein [Gammaproteobacteria bacterium]
MIHPILKWLIGEQPREQRHLARIIGSPERMIVQNFTPE